MSLDGAAAPGAAAGSASSEQTIKLAVKVCIRPGTGHAELKRRELNAAMKWQEVHQMIVDEGKIQLGAIQKVEIETLPLASRR